MEKRTDSANIWKIIAIAALCLLAVVSVLYAKAAGGKGASPAPAAEAAGEAATETAAAETPAEATGTEEPAETVKAEDILTLWSEDAEARQELTAYMEAVTDEGSADFIPKEDRIAGFDLDGTLFC